MISIASATVEDRVCRGLEVAAPEELVTREAGAQMALVMAASEAEAALACCPR